MAETEKLKVKKIVINGNNITNNETVLEHISIKNQVYSLEKLIKNIQISEENLSNLQIFNDVEISFWYTQEDEIQIEDFFN